MFARELEERPTRVDGRNGKGPLQFLPRGRRGWRSSPIIRRAGRLGWISRIRTTRDTTTLPSRKTYFAPHFRAASTNAWTLPSGVGWSTP